ncbi:MAG TPA: hypothetical protein VKV38_18255 [Trebonia sp.]|jgi:hypothetical protein|nr:hypothetical protein [Trebonia sp.]
MHGGGGGGHAAGHGGPVSHHGHNHHGNHPRRHPAANPRPDAHFAAYGADPEARHRRVRSRAGTVVRWTFLAVLMIVIIMLIGWAH